MLCYGCKWFCCFTLFQITKDCYFLLCCIFTVDYNLWDKYKPQPVDIKPGSIGDYYDICEEIGRYVHVIIIVISKLLKRHSKAKCMAPAYSRALRQIRGVVQRIVRGKIGSGIHLIIHPPHLTDTHLNSYSFPSWYP